MIFYLLLLILLGIVAVVIAPITLFPDVSLPLSIATAVGTIGGWFGLVWSVAPLTFSALIAAIVVIVGVETHIFSYKTIKWIYNKIPGIS